MTSDQRAALVRAIDDMPWTMEQIYRKAKAVTRAETYGSIGFDRWINAELVFTEEEYERKAYDMANQLITHQRREFIKQNQNMASAEMQDRLMEMGFVHVAAMYSTQYEKVKLEIYGKLIERTKAVELWIAYADEKTKRGLIKYLDEVKFTKVEPWRLELIENWKGLRRLKTLNPSHVSGDKVGPQYVRLFAPLLLEHVEELMAKEKNGKT